MGAMRRFMSLRVADGHGDGNRLFMPLFRIHQPIQFIEDVAHTLHNVIDNSALLFIRHDDLPFSAPDFPVALLGDP